MISEKMSGPPDSLAAQLRALGTSVTPEMVSRTRDLFAQLHTRRSLEDATVTRDARYGADERHRLDIFAAQSARPKPRPVLLFVHGGGFVGGDKSTVGSPFYDNVALWAVRNQFVGVNMTYRLAPSHRWPAGSEDVGLAVQWLRNNIAAYGGDAQRIYVMGQSAGAVHVAGYIAREHAAHAEGWQPAGALLISGLYDTRTMEKNALFEAYFGNDPRLSEPASFLAALASTQVPLMHAVAELDPSDFQRQTVVLLDACFKHHGRLPRFVQLMGHNHLSPILALETSYDCLGEHILQLTRRQKA